MLRSKIWLNHLRHKIATTKKYKKKIRIKIKIKMKMKIKKIEKIRGVRKFNRQTDMK